MFALSLFTQLPFLEYLYITISSERISKKTGISSWIYQHEKKVQNQAPGCLSQNPFGQTVEKQMPQTSHMAPVANSKQILVKYRFPVFGHFENLTKIMRYPIETDRIYYQKQK